MKRFSPEQLERAVDLHEHIEAYRWDVPTMDDNRRRSLCELWVAKARILLDQDMSDPDQQACLWVLGVVKAIAHNHQLHILGLGRNQTTNWNQRLREASARLRSTKEHTAAKATPTRKPKPARAVPSLPDLPNLTSHTIVVVGGEEDPLVLHRYKDAAFTLEWIPGNVRQVQAVVTRIGRGHLGGVVFLTDLNRHVDFEAVRAACRASETPMVLGTKGISAIGRALQKLDEQLTRRSA